MVFWGYGMSSNTPMIQWWGQSRFICRGSSAGWVQHIPSRWLVAYPVGLVICLAGTEMLMVTRIQNWGRNPKMVLFFVENNGEAEEIWWTNRFGVYPLDKAMTLHLGSTGRALHFRDFLHCRISTLTPFGTGERGNSWGDVILFLGQRIPHQLACSLGSFKCMLKTLFSALPTCKDDPNWISRLWDVMGYVVQHGSTTSHLVFPPKLPRCTPSSRLSRYFEA